MRLSNDKIWISGASGRLGAAMTRHLNPIDAEIVATDEKQVDITDQQAVLNFVDRLRPHIIINCSGMTNRNKCEDKPDQAYLLNAIGARNIAIAAARCNAKLIQLSTADVFDGKADRPYTEFDTPNPQSIYGKSRYEGEKYVRQFCHNHFIVRVSRLYSRERGQVEGIIQQAKNGKVVVGKDLYASPTSAYELAQFIIDLMQGNSYGTIHASGGGYTTMYDFAKEIIDYAGIPAEIVEVSDVDDMEYRPGFMALEDYILKIIGDYSLPHWKDMVHDYIDREGLRG